MVSVIIPMYNSENSIIRALESVNAQSMDDIEIICVDDNSTDKSVELVKKYAKKNTNVILLENSENRGAGYTRQIGIEESSGEYIAFLDSDDVWLNGKLEKQTALMTERDLDFTCTSYTSISTNSNNELIVPYKITYRRVLLNNPIGCSTVIIRKNAIGSIKFPFIRKRQDWAFWLLLLRSGIKCYGLSENLTNYYKTPNSLSEKKLSLVAYHFKVFNKILGYNILLSILFTTAYVFSKISRS
jgi:teichuronic acid biosynthesis glycosyltransferase TuaG